MKSTDVDLELNFLCLVTGKEFKHVTKKDTKQNTQNITDILIINNQQKYLIVVKNHWNAKKWF